MNILHVKSIKTYSCPVYPSKFLAISAVLSLLYHHCYPCQKTKSRLHTPISTLVHAEVVCAPKILPIGIFLSHTLRSKITAPWDMSQYQNFARISLETEHSKPRRIFKFCPLFICFSFNSLSDWLIRTIR